MFHPISFFFTKFMIPTSHLTPPPFSLIFPLQSSILHIHLFDYIFITMKKRLSATSKTRSSTKEDLGFDWELRPGGLLVQRRFVASSPSDAPLITIKISHDSSYHHLTLPSQSTFGDLKRALAHKTGLEPNEQRLLFRGKEKDDNEFLHMAGVEDMSKLILMEDPASKERKLEEIKKNQHEAYESILKVRAEVDNISNKVVGLGANVENGVNVADKEFVGLTELLMVKLLELDSIKADGEARAQRRVEVRRVQSLVDAVDNMKARNSISSRLIDEKTDVSLCTKWEAFDSGVGSCGAENTFKLSTKITQDWESFD